MGKKLKRNEKNMEEMFMANIMSTNGLQYCQVKQCLLDQSQRNIVMKKGRKQKRQEFQVGRKWWDPK